MRTLLVFLAGLWLGGIAGFFATALAVVAAQAIRDLDDGGDALG